MMMKIVLVAVVLTAGFACKHNSYKREETAKTTYGQGYEASKETLTPMDQTRSSKEDLAMTAKIREIVTDDDSLSMKAQNVKIITLQGLTTLRGPVETFAEKSRVEQLARRAGAKNINNQLEVTTKTE